MAISNVTLFFKAAVLQCSSYIRDNFLISSCLILHPHLNINKVTSRLRDIVNTFPISHFQRLLTDESPRLRNALRYTIYGKSGVFDAERFIDVMQAFENFISAAKSGGGEDLNGNMAELGVIQNQTSFLVPGFPSIISQPQQPIKTRAALAFLLSDKGNFFREFLLDEVCK